MNPWLIAGALVAGALSHADEQERARKKKRKKRKKKAKKELAKQQLRAAQSLGAGESVRLSATGAFLRETDLHPAVRERLRRHEEGW